MPRAIKIYSGNTFVCGEQVSIVVASDTKKKVKELLFISHKELSDFFQIETIEEAKDLDGILDDNYSFALENLHAVCVVSEIRSRREFSPPRIYINDALYKNTYMQERG